MAEERQDPLRELRSLQEEMERRLDAGQARGGLPLDGGGWMPPVDICEDAQALVLKMDLPDLEQQDIEVRIEDQVLIISGERRFDEGEGRLSYLRVERVHGPFHRTFALPPGIDEERVRATCERGVLKVVLPKGVQKQPRQITVETG